MAIAARIRVRGQVQGVGFRPFIWRLAATHGIVGEVRNDAEGVLIRAQAAGTALDQFVAAIATEAPPLARIDALAREEAAVEAGLRGFSIVETAGGAARTGVTPDALLCPACLAEISDPGERRAGYPFANCTHCGPRFSIVETIPYDRAATTMGGFEMCPDCRTEYADPGDRRFHAQPIACPVCGPRAWLEIAGTREETAPIARAAELLRQGGIVAVKGIGGFQLACDASDEDAVATLRARKRRPHKPFALMPGGGLAGAVAAIRAYARVSDEEAALLADPAGPILLLDRRADGAPLAPSVAPGLDLHGWMLPTTPLHHLLSQAADRPLVMTSGNRSGEPQAVENAEARETLGAFADAFLMHDRPIARRLDDSVARVQDGELRLIRRARGFAPATLEAPPGFEDAPQIFAAGGDLKAALCLLKDGRALPSHHLGDLEDALSFSEYEAAADDLIALFDLDPAAIACDAHPAYRATGFAEALAARLGRPVERVQHHHAHIAGAMAEAGWPRGGAPVLGIALDGTGYGLDGTIWGGELLLCDYAAAARLGGLAPCPAPGGDAASREPWRNLAAQLDRAFGASEADARLAATPLAAALAGKPVATLRAMTKRGVNAPLSSSTGRLFDAVAAALEIAFDAQSFEGQTGMRLEALARAAGGAEAAEAPYRFGDAPDQLDPAPMWAALLEDLAAGVAPERIAARFHLGLAHGFAERASALAAAHGAGALALSGGVAQNAVLSAAIHAAAAPSGLAVLVPKETPANDGGLAYGQAMVAAARRPACAAR